MSSSAPEGSRRNSMCHTAARTSPMTTTRRESVGVAKNSRTANRYTMPASVKEAMKYGPPLSPKLREQIVSAPHKLAPSMYTLLAGVIFTILPCPSVIVPPEIPTLEAIAPCAAPLPEPAATPLPTESGRRLSQHRKKEPRNLRKAQPFVRAIEVSPERYWCPFRRVRKAWDEKPSRPRDSSRRRVLVQ